MLLAGLIALVVFDSVCRLPPADNDGAYGGGRHMHKRTVMWNTTVNTFVSHGLPQFRVEGWLVVAH